jgi:lipopolysaccharide transport protein LptA
MKKILIIIILSLILPTLSNANQINISSDELNFDKLKHELIFTGNVYAYDGQIKIWSEILKVILNEDNSEIDKIFARKSVKIIREDINALSDNAFYKPSNEILELKGNVNVVQGDDTIECDKLVLDLEKSVSIMTSGSNKRVEAIIKINQ